MHYFCTFMPMYLCVLCTSPLHSLHLSYPDSMPNFYTVCALPLQVQTLCVLPFSPCLFAPSLCTLYFSCPLHYAFVPFAACLCALWTLPFVPCLCTLHIQCVVKVPYLCTLCTFTPFMPFVPCLGTLSSLPLCTTFALLCLCTFVPFAPGLCTLCTFHALPLSCMGLHTLLCFVPFFCLCTLACCLWTLCTKHMPFVPYLCKLCALPLYPLYPAFAPSHSVCPFTLKLSTW